MKSMLLAVGSLSKTAGPEHRNEKGLCGVSTGTVRSKLGSPACAFAKPHLVDVPEL